MSRLVGCIKEKLWVLPDETVVYPGHGPSTTIAREKAHNPFLQ
jgi:glyoxylase-like metal-dependent hydrolase (beta-lactamase superfamily II)